MLPTWINLHFAIRSKSLDPTVRKILLNIQHSTLVNSRAENVDFLKRKSTGRLHNGHNLHNMFKGSKKQISG